jgi:hypothetical protein
VRLRHLRQWLRTGELETLHLHRPGLADPSAALFIGRGVTCEADTARPGVVSVSLDFLWRTGVLRKLGMTSAECSYAKHS